MTLEELKVVISAETKKFSRSIKSAKSDFSKFTTSTQSDGKKVERSVNNVNTAVTKLKRTVTTLGLAKIFKDAFVKSTGVASDLQEVQNVVDVAFGNMSKDVESFASKAIKELGMSELSAKQYSSTFMAMSNGMGVASEAGKDMAIQLTRLTGDMASFYNVEQDVANTALKSVYTGETEALKKFGVVMTENNLKAFALSRGIKKEYSEMSQAEKVALRYNYVMQSTANAQGDFARTSGSWANQVRILKEQWAQFMGIIGNNLIRVFTPVLELLNRVLGKIIDIANAMANAFGGKQITATTGILTEDVEDISIGFSDASASADKLKRTIMGFDELNTLDNLKSSVNNVLGGLGIANSIPTSGFTFDDLPAPDNSKNNGVNEWADNFAESLEKAKTKISDAWDKFKKDYEENGFTVDSFVTLALTTVNAVVDALTDAGIENEVATSLMTGFAVFSATGSVAAGLLATIGSGVVLSLLGIDADGEKINGEGDNLYKQIQGLLPWASGLLSWITSGSMAKGIMTGTLTYWIGEIATGGIRMTPEQFVSKVKRTMIAVGLGSILGAVVGGAVGGGAGALIGFKIGATLTLAYESVVHDLTKVQSQLSEGYIRQQVVGGQTWTTQKQAKEALDNAKFGNTTASGGYARQQAAPYNLASTANERTLATKNYKNGISAEDTLNTMSKMGIDLSKSITAMKNAGFTGANIQAGLRKVYGLSTAEIRELRDKYGFAKGGVLSVPTPAILAEYSGASSNREVVAPEKTIFNTVQEANGDMIGAFVQIGKQIIKAIEDKDMEVSIGDETIAQSASRGNKSYKKRTGYSLI